MEIVKGQSVPPNTGQKQNKSLNKTFEENEDVAKSKLGFYVPFNSQGHIGTVLRIATCGTRTHRGDSL